ncbi:ATP synthase I chain [Variovorax sp. PBL-E5]|nr:ATP synthase I chain [Variovorax sp. PBL-E5]
MPESECFLFIINGFVKIWVVIRASFEMKTIARDALNARVPEEVQDPDDDFKPLTADEARRLRDRKPSISPWRVIAVQVVGGLLVALVTWGLTGRQNLGWSAGYGALAVVVPAAVFARGLTGRFSSLNPGTAMFGFLLWEMVKMALTVAMLIAAPRLITALSWPAMLIGLVVTMKAAWVAVMLAPRRLKLRDE